MGFNRPYRGLVPPSELNRAVSIIKELTTIGVVMTFGYAKPFSFQIGGQPGPTVSGVRHGVTEITLSDGRLVRATLHVKAVKIDPKKPGSVDVAYNVVAEIMPVPREPVREVHETIQ